MDVGIALGIATFVGTVALFLGYVVGSMNRGRKKTPAVESKPELTTPRILPQDSVEVLSIWRVERTGKLLALLDGKPLSPSHIDDTQKEKVHQILMGMHGMIGEAMPAVSPVVPPPPPAEIPPPAIVPTETEPVPDPLGNAPRTLSGDQPIEEQGSKVYFADTLPQPVTFRSALTSNPFKINVPKSASPSASPKTIVEQIDEILQSKLVGSPYAEKGIKLEEKPDGMAVYVGDVRYDGIDAVPDPTVRALIKESAREWNEKASRRR